MTTSTRLWELSEEIQDLENAIALIADDETLTEEDRETKLQETFNQWLSKGEYFKVKVEQVARYIRHQEALAEARKIEARRIRELASQAENGAARLRKYLITQMIRSNVQKIDGVSTKIGLRKKQQEVLLNVSPEKLPAEYVKVTYQPDLTKIRKLLKADAQGAIGWGGGF
jgi:Siphovirus Gp157